jgi:deltex-like protein
MRGGAPAAPAAPAAAAAGGGAGQQLAGTYDFVAHDGRFDFARLTRWTVLSAAAREYDPAAVCPIDASPLGTDEAVVRLSCHTAAIPCVYRRRTAEQALAAGNGRCPSCNFQYSLPGPQPSGTLTVHDGGPPCEGQLADDSTGAACPSSWVLSYGFRGGVQGPQHPRPGVAYSGTRRTAYLPQNRAGARAVRQLIRAWQAGQIFMVGDSVTSGVTDTTVWAGIHQKTNYSGGTVRHGWPDATYFDRLSNECAGRNIYAPGEEPPAPASAPPPAAGGAGAGAGAAAAAAPPPPRPAAAAAPAADPAADAALRAELASLQTQLQQAMQSQNRAAIADLMRRRAAAQAKLGAS